MNERDESRVFGDRVAGASYTQRPSAYAIIVNEGGHVAVVRTMLGVFLPGGGIETGETAEQAVFREVLEECGVTIQLSARLPEATQLVYSQTELIYYEKPSTFFVAVVEEYQGGAQEADHEVLWVPPDEAASLVAHESHRWAVRRGTS